MIEFIIVYMEPDNKTQLFMHIYVNENSSKQQVTLLKTNLL